MINVVLLVEDRRRTREFLVEICFVHFPMVNSRNHRWVIEAQMIGPTSDNGTFDR